MAVISNSRANRRGALTLVTNSVIAWTTEYYGLAVESLRRSERHVDDDVLAHISPAHDNALMETINGLYKAECIRTQVFHDGPYQTIADVEYATASWVEWCNNRRLHSSLGMISLIETTGSEAGTVQLISPGAFAADAVVPVVDLLPAFAAPVRL